METKEITLAGETRTVLELPRRKNAAWRKQLQAELGPVMEFLQGTKDLDLDSLDQIAPFLMEIIAAVDNGLDKALELVLAYMDLDKTQAGQIREAVYDSEIAEALMEVLLLAYPLGSLAPALERLTVLQALAPPRRMTGPEPDPI